MKRPFTLLILASLLCALCGFTKAAESTKPNIILILAGTGVRVQNPTNSLP